jgi:UDP-glucose 4-epimerase
MTTLVLGGSGFIGSWLSRVLVERNVPTSALVRPSSDLWRLASLPPLDIIAADPAEWPDVVASVRPDVIVSLDWSGVAGASRNDDAQWKNLDRQLKVLQAAAESGTRRFVGVGSQAEYGPKSGRITEDMTAHPVTGYGEAKLAAMEASRSFSADSGMQWVWARIFSVYGPLDNGHWLLPLVADSLRADRDIELTTGEQRWSYLYALDAGAALAALATHEDASGIYNVGNPSAPRLRDTLERFASMTSSTGRLLFGARPFEPNPVMHLEPDMSRLAGLGWSATVGMDKGLGATMRWLSGQDVDDVTNPGHALPPRQSAGA